MAPPHFTLFWADTIPHRISQDANGRAMEVAVELINCDAPAEFLLLAVASGGPNKNAPDHARTHGSEPQRFALHSDGRLEKPAS